MMSTRFHHIDVFSHSCRFYVNSHILFNILENKIKLKKPENALKQEKSCEKKEI